MIIICYFTLLKNHNHKKPFFTFSHTQQVISRTRYPEELPITRTQATTSRTPHTESTERFLQPNTENTVNVRPNYRGCQRFEAPTTEETTSKLGNPNQTWVIQKIYQVGQARTQKTKIKLIPKKYI